MKHFSETDFCVILCLAFSALLFVAVVQKLSVWVQRFTLISLSATEMHYCLRKKTEAEKLFRCFTFIL